MDFDNMNLEIVSSFQRNGKTYLILELEKNSIDTSGLIPWPNWDDFAIRGYIEDDKLIIVILYKGEEKWRREYYLPGQCGNLDDIDVFKVEIDHFKFTIYLRYLWICAYLDEEDKYVNYSFQVWARTGQLKTKLGEANDDVDYPDLDDL